MKQSERCQRLLDKFKCSHGHELYCTTGMKSLRKDFSTLVLLMFAVRFSPNKAAGDRRRERGRPGDEGGEPEDAEGEEGHHP